RRKALLIVGARSGTRTHTVVTTRPSNVRVCQFRHPGTMALRQKRLYHRRSGASRGSPHHASGHLLPAGEADVDRVLGANLLTEPAAHTRLGVDQHRHALEGIPFQLQAVEGTDIHAELAARAVDRIDNGLGPIGPLPDAGQDLPPLVLDALDRAGHGAGPAVDAELGRNHVELLPLSADGLGGANLDAGCAADTCLPNKVGHQASLLAGACSRLPLASLSPGSALGLHPLRPGPQDPGLQPP